MPLRRRRDRPGSSCAEGAVAAAHARVRAHGAPSRSLSSNGAQDLLAQAGVSWHREIVQAAHTDDWERLERLWTTLQQQEQQRQQQQQQRSHRQNRAPSTPRRASKMKLQLQRHHSSDNPKSSLWNRITQRTNSNSNNIINSNGAISASESSSNDWDNNNNNNNNGSQDGRFGLLSVDEELRTPLHLLLTIPAAPTALILNLLRAEPRAATQPTIRGRLPLHLAVVHRPEDVTVLEALVDAFPAAISVSDRSARQRTPLQYAMEQAYEYENESYYDNGSNEENNSNNSNANEPPPRTYWAPCSNDNNDDASSTPASAATLRWQRQQTARWSTVHWLLVASATHPQTCLSIGGRKPMLVEALLHAAPPAVVQLLLGASVNLLSLSKTNHGNNNNNSALDHNSNNVVSSAFGLTTLYTCIARHYPNQLLQCLARQCPQDAARTRDGTGMGLVAALYISGCFVHATHSHAQEWTVVEDFDVALRKIINETKRLPQDSAMLVDWWNKMEFLIGFCAQRQPEGRIVNQNNNHSKKNNNDCGEFSKQFLLHDALTNTDVPPLVIRLLLALYPDSIHRPDPVSGASPLHLVASHREYIPRNYEVLAAMPQRQQQRLLKQPDDSNDDSSSVLEVILKLSPRNAVFQRHCGRLPLHHAIAAGRQLETIVPLLVKAEQQMRQSRRRRQQQQQQQREDNNEETENNDRSHHLMQRDPQTGLFPFQLAAAFEPDQEDSFRWSCMARNQYSSAVWQGLTKKQKAAAVRKVAHRQDLGHLETVYGLLRCKPEALVVFPRNEQKAQRRKSNDSSASASSSLEDTLGESNLTAMSLYLDWCFTAKDTIAGTRLYLPNDEHQNMLEQAVQFLITTGSCCLLPDSFDLWWNKMEVCLRNECRLNKYPLFGRLTMGRRMRVPVRRDEFLLHAALSNTETPPEIIKLVLAINSSAVSLYLPGTLLLPLHIAAGTPSYVPRPFERVAESSLELVLRRHPAAVRVPCQGRLPLHVAIAAEKPSSEIALLVQEEPRSLKKRDPRTGLVPFLFAALHREETAREDGPTFEERKARLELVARNQNGVHNGDWEELEANEHSKRIQRVREQNELEKLSTVFILLRRDASVLVDSIDWFALEAKMNKNANTNHQDSRAMSDHERSLHASFHTPSTSIMDALSDKEGAEGEEKDDNSSSNESFMSRRRSSVMVLLTQTCRRKQDNIDVYDCDATVISTVDIMGSLHSTINKSKSTNDGTLTSNDSDDSSIDAFSFAHSEDGSYYDEFAEDTVAGYTETDCCHEENGTRETDQMSDDDDDSLVSFEIRKVSRLSNMELSMDEEGYSDIQSSMRTTDDESRKPKNNLCRPPFATRQASDKSIASSTMSKTSGKASAQPSEPSHFSFKIGRPEIARKEMLWMSPELLQPRILTESSHREEDDAKITISLSLPPKPSAPSNRTPASPVSSFINKTSQKSPSIHSKSSNPRRSLLGNEVGSDSEEDEDDGVNLAFFKTSSSAMPRQLNHSNSLPTDLPAASAATDLKALNSLESSLHSATKEKRPLVSAFRGPDFDASSALDSMTLSRSSGILYDIHDSFHVNEILGGFTEDDQPGNDDGSTSSKHSEQSKHVSFSIHTEAEADPDVVGQVLDRADDEICHANKPYFFDRASFKWTVYPANQRGGSDNPITVQKPEMTFDKKMMRWVAKKNSVNENAAATKCKDASTSLKRTRSQHTQSSADSGAPFVESFPMKPPVAKSGKTRQRMLSARRLTKPPSRPKRLKGSAVGMHELAQDRMKCLLCEENGREVLMVPCRHLCICRRCSVKEDRLGSCPLCKCAVAGRMLIF